MLFPPEDAARLLDANCRHAARSSELLHPDGHHLGAGDMLAFRSSLVHTVRPFSGRRIVFVVWNRGRSHALERFEQAAATWLNLCGGHMSLSRFAGPMVKRTGVLLKAPPDQDAEQQQQHTWEALEEYAKVARDADFASLGMRKLEWRRVRKLARSRTTL